MPQTFKPGSNTAHYLRLSHSACCAATVSQYNSSLPTHLSRPALALLRPPAPAGAGVSAPPRPVAPGASAPPPWPSWRLSAVSSPAPRAGKSLSFPTENSCRTTTQRTAPQAGGSDDEDLSVLPVADSCCIPRLSPPSEVPTFSKRPMQPLTPWHYTLLWTVQLDPGRDSSPAQQPPPSSAWQQQSSPRPPVTA